MNNKSISTERAPLAYSIPGASATSTLSIRKISDAIRRGELKAYRKGRRRLVLREDLEAYLKSEETA
jgi:excisionase family DNA binding protein